MGLITKIFGTYSERELKQIYPIADKIEAMEPEYKAMTDAQLTAKTAEFKERLARGETLDDILPEAFATVREASVRVLGMRPFRVQLVGGIVLHQGRIAEMKTGEGKTLVATLPAYLNALTGRGVHIVTVNDYLAKYQSEWMGKVYRFLGLTVGLIIHDMDKPARQKAYAADITYGTNNEMGFDYLRDNMAGDGPAGPCFRHCGRGGLHPHRRGPDPADYLRHGGEVHPALRHGGDVRPAPEEAGYRRDR